jgi:hypothetical protein
MPGPQVSQRVVESPLITYQPMADFTDKLSDLCRYLYILSEREMPHKTRNEDLPVQRLKDTQKPVIFNTKFMENNL